MCVCVGWRKCWLQLKKGHFYKNSKPFSKPSWAKWNVFFNSLSSEKSQSCTFQGLFKCHFSFFFLLQVMVRRRVRKWRWSRNRMTHYISLLKDGAIAPITILGDKSMIFNLQDMIWSKRRRESFDIAAALVLPFIRFILFAVAIICRNYPAKLWFRIINQRLRQEIKQKMFSERSSIQESFKRCLFLLS